jgi:hypothetical protein
VSAFNSFDELWSAVVTRYPEFANDEHVLQQRARGLKRLLQQAWDEGHSKGVANGRALEAMERDRKPAPTPGSGLFDDIFGRRST